MTRRVLLTGFEPFGNHARNPSWDAVERVAATWDGPEEVRTLLLPVEFRTAAERIGYAIDPELPDAIIGVGLAAGRAEITPERVTVNIRDGRIADNAGALPVDEPIEQGGAAAHWSTLPIKAIVAALRDAGIPAAVSNTAGTFVCNEVFYTLQSQLAGHPGVRSGFIHVPATPETGGDETDATLPLDTIVEALRIAVRVTLDTSGDASIPGGAIA